jgi:tRNA A-37 threonylcarbamoyl transferase component Bud32
MLQLEITDFYELLRLKFKISTGRSIIKIHKYIIKIYDDVNELAYEYNVLSNIALSKPIKFRVPRVFKFLKTQNYNALIMEYIAGRHLDNYILDFLLRGNSYAVKIFYRLGKAVRELHSLNLNGLRNSALPSSCSELKKEVTKLSRSLVAWKLINNKLFNIVLCSLEKMNLTNEFFLPVSLHGELYFTHIIMQDGKFVFLDLHNAQRGPSYFDLAMLSISLYVSLAFSYYSPKKFTPLIEAFLKGYYGKALSSEIIKSMKLLEFYVALREILTYARALCAESSPIIGLINTLKIRRLKAAIKEVILPKLMDNSHGKEEFKFQH